MRLLIVTQVVDSEDPILGFFHEWVLEFARRCESVEVICLREGIHEFPPHVRVHSLGKEKRVRSAFSYAISFKLLAWKLRHDYDAVFVHMNPEYLCIAGPMWKFLHKRAVLWYMHKSVTLRLKLGIFFANTVLTGSTDSMRVRTAKKKVVGHGIASEAFPLVAPPANDSPLQLLTVSRVSPVKRIELIIEAVAILHQKGIEAVLTIAGAPLGEAGERYAQNLREQVARLDLGSAVRFVGPVSHNALTPLFAEAHLFVHASDTGSLDKASLEPLLAGVPVVTTSRELAQSGCPTITESAPTPENIAEAIIQAKNEIVWKDEARRGAGRTWVLEHHGLSRLIERILVELSERR